MDQPQVSIVIPVYNKAAYIQETLESALAQTYQNIEIILVDDGSTDGSLEIIQTYFEKYPDKIILIDQENQGVSTATNAGIQASSGDYIQFLDADDLLSKEKIEFQLLMIKDKNWNVASICKWSTFYNDSDRIDDFGLNIYSNFDSGIDYLLSAWNNAEMMAISSYLCSRELILKAGTWNENLTINQDGEFFCRVLLNCEEVIFENTQKVYYRKPGVSNVSQQKSYQASASLLESYRCYQREILKKEDSQRVREALARNYLRFIYVTHPQYPDLIEEAERELKKFQFEKPVRIGGPRFQALSRFLGFKNALRIKRLLQ
jgi:glycosyltransferase involved in cell wall biosynthesis